VTSTGLRNGTAAALVLALAAGLGLGPLPARADGITDGNQGREALLAGKLDEAIRLFTHALTFGGLTAKNQAITLNLRANAYLEKGQTEVALDDANESLRRLETLDAHFTRAKIYVAQLRFDDAIDDLNRTMAMGGQAADVWALRGHAQLYAGRLDAAIKDLDQSIQLAPTYGFAWRTRGHAWMNMGQDDKAIADETKAIALDPKDIEAHWLRAYAYRYRKKDLAKAVADYSEALRIDPTDSSARTSRADTYEEMGRYAEAQADYDAWIQQNPRAPFGYWARGRLELVQGKAGPAAADLAKAVSLKPSDAYAVLWLHLARAKQGANDAAELQANAARTSRALWPGPLLDYFTGKADAAAVLAKAAQGQGKARATQLCEADLFLGQDALTKGRRSEGLERLQAGAGACEGSIREAKLVRADLQGLGVAAPKPAATQMANAPPRPSSAKPKPQIQAQTQTSDDPLQLRGSLK
jgi:tetratricopeptide (TPR) repeat protein